jgi:hypothetical protein
VLSWVARGGDAVCGKLVNEIVGIADVINDLYAGPRPMLPKSGCKSTTVGAGCDCRPAKHWISSLNSRSLSPCLAEASRMLPRNKCCSFASCLAKASCTLPSTNPLSVSALEILARIQDSSRRHGRFRGVIWRLYMGMATQISKSRLEAANLRPLCYAVRHIANVFFAAPLLVATTFRRTVGMPNDSQQTAAEKPMDPSTLELAQKTGLPEEPLRGDLIKHISAEIVAHQEWLATLRSRMGFTVLIGPFLVLGSVLIATKSAPTIMVWPTERPPWASFISAVLCFIGCGVYGAFLDKHGTKQCDFWRAILVSVAKGESISEVHLDFKHHHFWAYVPGFVLSLGAFLGMTYFFMSLLHPNGKI